MRRFLLKICIWAILPLITLISFYIWIDPFRVARPFSVEYFLQRNIAKTNREYFSYHLFLQNDPTCQFNSFIFGSSRTHALNSYQWSECLGEEARAFIFSSWRENIKGIFQKITYLDKQDIRIDNALILLDCGAIYSFNTLDGEAPLTNHFYKLSGETLLRYHWDYFSAFISKPSKIYDMVRDALNDTVMIVQVDTITNDANVNNRLLIRPLYPEEIIVHEKQPTEEHVLESLLTDELKKYLIHIRSVFDKHNTNFKVVIVPNYYKEKINLDDMRFINNVFGELNVYDFSGDSEWTAPNFYFDVEHFNEYVGWKLLEEIYK